MILKTVSNFLHIFLNEIKFSGKETKNQYIVIFEF